MFRMPLPGEGPARAEISPEAAQAAHEPQQGGGGCFAVETPCEAAESQAAAAAEVPAAPPQKPPSKKQRTASNPQAQSASAPLGGDVLATWGQHPPQCPRQQPAPSDGNVPGAPTCMRGWKGISLRVPCAGDKKAASARAVAAAAVTVGVMGHGGGGGGRGQSPLPRLWKALEA